MGISSKRAIVAVAAIAAFVLSAVSAAAFGTGGKTVFNLGGVNSPNSLSKDSTGRLVIAGSSTSTGSFNYTVARFSAEGIPDLSFDGDAKTAVQLTDFDGARSGTVVKGDKIVSVGDGKYPDGNQALVLRHTSAGALDSSFSGNGVLKLSLPDSRLESVVEQRDGRLVAVGFTGKKLLLVRIKRSGKLDKSFSKDGIVTVRQRKVTSGSEIALQRDGKIVIEGVTTQGGLGSPEKHFLARCRPNGKLDRSFGKKGLRTVRSLSDFFSVGDIAIGRKGTIVVSASYRKDVSADSKAAVFSYTKSGKPNRKFSKDGVATLGVGTEAQAGELLVQRDGRIVFGGRMDNATVDWLLIRFTTRGKADKSFSGDGWTSLDIDGGGDVVSGLVEQGKGKIVAAGYGGGQTALARFKRNGSLDG